MRPRSSHALILRLGAVSAAIGCLGTLVWSAIPAGYAISRFGSPVTEYWPSVFSNHVAPSLVLSLLTLLSLLVAVWPVGVLRKVWASSMLFGVVFCAMHAVTLNKAEFYGGIFSATWWFWFVHTEASTPARLRQDGPRLATFVLMGTFLPAALGKTLPFHSPVLHVRNYGLPPLIFDGPIPESMRTGLMWLVVTIEGWVGLSPFLPLRAALWAAAVVLTGMFVWDLYLLPALLPVGSVAVASLILLHDVDASDGSVHEP